MRSVYLYVAERGWGSIGDLFEYFVVGTEHVM